MTDRFAGGEALKMYYPEVVQVIMIFMSRSEHAAVVLLPCLSQAHKDIVLKRIVA